MITAEALAATHSAAFRKDRAWTETEFSDLLNDRHVWVTGDTACFVMGRCIAGEAEILTLATAPTAQRRGLATRTLAAFEVDARARGADDLFLEVAADNVAARALYDRCGFIEVGRRRDYYRRKDGPAADALVLRKTLT